MDNFKIIEEQLKQEQRRLNILVGRALRGPIVKNQEIIDQSRKVDKLIKQIQQEKEKTQENTYAFHRT